MAAAGSAAAALLRFLRSAPCDQGPTVPRLQQRWFRLWRSVEAEARRAQVVMQSFVLDHERAHAMGPAVVM